MLIRKLHLSFYSFCFLIFFQVLDLSINAQQYQFDQFDEDEGLKSPFINVIEQDSNRFLFLGTGEGLYMFDGIEFTEIKIGANFDSHITASFKDSYGVLWFGNRSGGLGKIQDENLIPVISDNPERGMVKSIVEYDDRGVLVACQASRILHLSKDGKFRSFESGLENYNLYDLCVTSKKELLVGTDMGLLIGKFNEKSEITFVSDNQLVDAMVVSILKTSESEYLLATAYDGLFEWTKDGLVHLAVHSLDFNEVQINSVSHGKNDDFWVSSNNGALYSMKRVFDSDIFEAVKIGSGEWSNLSISCAFEDIESVLWLGTKGIGLLKLVDDQFILTKPNSGKGTSILSICHMNSSIYSIGESTLYFQENSQSDLTVMKDFSNLLSGSSLTCLALESENTILLGTSDQGLFSYNKLDDKVQRIVLDKGNSSDAINHILVKGEKKYISTNFGLYVMVNREIVNHFSILNGLNHNKVNSVYALSDDRIWIGGSYGVAVCENDQIGIMKLDNGNGILDISGICQDNMGQMWVSTMGSGVFMSNDQGSTWKKYTKKDGLFSDFCSSIVFDLNHYMWVGHRGGLTRIETGSAEFRIYEPEISSTATFNENAICSYNNDLILFGTSNGLLIYSKSSDLSNFMEPVIRFTSTLIAGIEYGYSPQYFLDAGQYSIHFDFVAVSLKNPLGVQYQYILEGYDMDWSPYSSISTVNYGKIGPGTYTFKVRAINADGIGGEEIHQVQIFIDKPFWQKWWFISIIIISSIFSARFMILSRERKLKRDQKILETKLEERTHELVEKNSVLSMYNKDITDSIQYAKNIQNAILPSAVDLEFFFKNSFVFNLPRNIVSGDFFWVEKYERKVVLACVDCTGHGVPGAFMSIIGTKLFRESSQINVNQTPDKLLVMLDKAIESTLNSSRTSIYLRDGMDAAVVEIDLDTLELKFAGAKRPVLIFTPNELIEIKGDRFSLGGNIENEKVAYTLHSRQLNEGDQVYLFSDGLADQFGGSKGKKLKNTGFYNMLSSLNEFQMNQKVAKFEELFNSWKGDNVQVDDILVVGVQV